MANCPKCGGKLHIYHWKQNCPYCNVNLVYYNSNERLLAESEQAEIAHARFQPGVDRAKASTIGSLPAIMRIVLTVLPLGALMLPLAKLTGPEKSVSINAIKLFNYLSSQGFGNIISGALKGNLVAVSVITALLSAVLILIGGLFLMKSLGPHGKAINLTFDISKITLSVISAITFSVADKSEYFTDYTSGHISIGAFVYIGLFIALLIYSNILAKKGLKIKHQLCLIGGIPSDEYFKMVEDGVSELEIRKKMVEILTEMQTEVRKKGEEARAKEEAEKANRK